MKGILFKPDMHKSICDGIKTVTRRVIPLACGLDKSYDHKWVCFNERCNWWEYKGRSRFSDLIEPFVLTPRYQVGETLYVKEAHYRYGHWKEVGVTKTGRIMFEFEPMIPYGKDIYFPDNLPSFPLIIHKGIDAGVGWYLRSPLFLPAYAARDFVQITDIAAEQLQKITEEDAIDEGTIRYPKKISQGHIYRALSDYVYEAYPLKWGFDKGNRLKADYPSLGHARFYSLDKKDGQCIHLTPKEAFSLLEDEEMTYREAYYNLWDSINPKYPRKSNPWLWRYEFRRLTDA